MVLRQSHQPRSFEMVGMFTQGREARELQAASRPQDSAVPIRTLASVCDKRGLYHSALARLMNSVNCSWHETWLPQPRGREGSHGKFASSYGVLGRKMSTKRTHQIWHM